MAETLTYPRSTPDELQFEQGSHGERFPAGTEMQARTSVTLNTDQIVQPRPMLQIAFFGKVHWITPEDFVEYAEVYQKMQRRDCLLLLDEVSSNRHYYQQWAFPDGACDAIFAALVRAGEGTSRVIKNFFSDVKAAPKPSLEEFDDLIQRLKLLGADIAIAASDLRYEKLHQLGVELTQAREDMRRLLKLVNGFQQRAISAAETGEKTAEVFESASFQILALVPTLTLMDPIREALYRIGLIGTRALARAAGAGLAETGKRGVLQQVSMVLQADVPPLIADLIGGKLNRAMTAAGRTNLSREIIVTIARQIVEFLCGATLIVMDHGFNFTEEDCKQLLEARMVSIVCSLLSTMLGGRPGDPQYTKLAKASVESILSNLFSDYVTARDTAKAQNREVWEVFLEGFPATLVRIAQGVFTGVAARNAATVQHKMAVQGAQETADWTKSISYLRAQNASSIYDAETAARVPARLLSQNKTPLPSLPTAQQRRMFETFALPPEIVNRLRRCAHDFEWVIVARMPSMEMARHFKDLWKWPKPMWIKAKSSNLQDKAGLVRKPSQNPPTHNNFAKAQYWWNYGYKDILSNGGMVRQDGIVFHPDMLKHWAKGNPRDAVTAEKAHQILTRMNQHTAETADFTTTEGQANLRRAAGGDYEDVKGFLDRVDIGFYPDLDMKELINQRTGERIALGDGSEKGEGLNYVQRNRSMLDQAININHDNENVPPEWLTPEGKVRISAEIDTPFRQALIQHGGDYEIDEKHAAGGPVVIISMNGEIRGAEDDHDLETHLFQLLGPKYKSEQEREKSAVRSSLGDPTNWAEANGKGQRIMAKNVARVKPIRPTAVKDMPASGHEMPKEDVHASLLHRGLSTSETDLAKVSNFRSLFQVQQVLEANDSLIAVDLEAKNLVVAVAANQGVADGLARLAGTYRDLDLARSGVTLWLELYTSDRPVTADYITGRLGSSNPAIGCLDPFNDKISSTSPEGGKHHYAFAIAAHQKTFSPTKEKNTDRGAIHRSHHARRKDMRDAFLTDVARYDHTYAHVHGWQLFDVWDDLATRKLSFTPAKVFGLEVAVFNSGLVTAMGFQELHDVASERFLHQLAG